MIVANTGTAPETGEIYDIELCSGESRHWQYLGPDSRAQIWWRDTESGLEFSEASLMYAWHIVGKASRPG
jgi:hypothetical protein